MLQLSSQMASNYIEMEMANALDQMQSKNNKPQNNIISPLGSFWKSTQTRNQNSFLKPKKQASLLPNSGPR